MVGHFRADKSCFHEHEVEYDDSHKNDSHNNDSHNDVSHKNHSHNDDGHNLDDEIVPGEETISVGPENGSMVPVAVVHVGFIQDI